MAYAYQLADPFLYSKLKEFAKENRRRSTDAESALWIFLKNNGLGKTFKRQFIIGQYIADFACLEAKLIVEIDGGHSSRRAMKNVSNGWRLRASRS